MDQRVAEKLHSMIMAFLTEAPGVLQDAKATMNGDEFAAFSYAVGVVLVEIAENLAYPFYVQHPELRPERMELPPLDRIRVWRVPPSRLRGPGTSGGGGAGGGEG